MYFLNGVVTGKTEKDFEKYYSDMGARCVRSLETGSREIVVRAAAALGVWMRFLLDDDLIEARKELLEINRR